MDTGILPQQLWDDQDRTTDENAAYDLMLWLWETRPEEGGDEENH